jgi:uncharacterized membrane protein YoaK (UPF0700 family)
MAHLPETNTFGGRLLDRPALHNSQPLVPILLAFCACFVDVVCILGLFHTFTAFITGTLVVLCTEVFHKGDNAVLKLFVLAMFLVSTLFWFTTVTRLVRAAGSRSGTFLPSRRRWSPPSCWSPVWAIPGLPGRSRR